jgi:hypothetical protein
VKKRAPETNITIRVGKDVLTWFRKRAGEIGRSNYRLLMSQVLTDRVQREQEAVADESRRERAYERARKRALRSMRNAGNLGMGTKITWTRDELHERHPEKKAK